jgi:hypothetical protein
MLNPYGYVSWYRVAPRDSRGSAKLGEGVRVLDSFKHSRDSLSPTFADRQRYVWNEAKRPAADRPMQATSAYNRRLNLVADAEPTLTRMEWTQRDLRATERRHRNRARRKGRTLVARY